MIQYMFTKVQIITSNLKLKKKKDWKEQVIKCMHSVAIMVHFLNYSWNASPLAHVPKNDV
jgi:hypothetical protein